MSEIRGLWFKVSDKTFKGALRLKQIIQRMVGIWNSLYRISEGKVKMKKNIKTCTKSTKAKKATGLTLKNGSGMDGQSKGLFLWYMTP